MNAPAPARVALNALSLTDLRNYASVQLSFVAPLIVLTGSNGAGKTNMLEGISLLTPGRGLRRAAFEEISRHGSAGGWAVAATVGRDGVETRIGTGLAPAGAGETRGRKMRVNGAPVS